MDNITILDRIRYMFQFNHEGQVYKIRVSFNDDRSKINIKFGYLYELMDKNHKNDKKIVDIYNCSYALENMDADIIYGYLMLVFAEITRVYDISFNKAVRIFGIKNFCHIICDRENRNH